jgi:hypothetical protein
MRSITLPGGLDRDSEKVNQVGWYRDWLASGMSSEAGSATLWIIGENVVAEENGNELFAVDFGLFLGSPDNGTGAVAPDVVGVGVFGFENGCVGVFTNDRFSLAGGCPIIRSYDGLSATTGTVTHRYRTGTVNSPYAAIIMNRNQALNWNTIMSSFSWFDIRDGFGDVPGRAETTLMRKILQCVLPPGCQQSEDATDVPGGSVEAAPIKTSLHQNTPNPFNPTTSISFDLARDGRVSLRIFDVSGRLVRTLVDRSMKAGLRQSLTWNGLSDAGTRVSSGVYFYQLVTDGFTDTKKLAILN